jgi:DNA invertase Pin-like site-specific DNA recombinase
MRRTSFDGCTMTHPKEQIRAALYLRVSTEEQHAENQLPELDRYAAAHGWQIAGRYVDQESGSKASRPALDSLMADARRGRFGVVVCWSISRFGRSMVNAVLAMHELTELGIRLVALQQAVDTGTVVGRGVAALLAALAEAELEEKRDRVKAGIRRVRAKGQRWGAPKKHIVPVREVEARLAAGESLGQIAADLEIPKTTVYRQLTASRRSSKHQS